MSREIQPSELLAKALILIRRDLRYIALDSKKGKLDHQAASDLVRYSNFLVDLLERDDEEEKRKKKKFAAMSTEELMKELEKFQKGPKDGGSQGP